MIIYIYRHEFRVIGTEPLDVAAHLSLLGESMKKMGAQLQTKKVKFTDYFIFLIPIYLANL